jgi:hypothetical protein
VVSAWGDGAVVSAWGDGAVVSAWRDVAISKASSGVIRRHQASSGVISGNPWSSPWRDVAISWKSARRSPESTPDPACGEGARAPW